MMIDFLKTYGIEVNAEQAFLLDAHLHFVLEKNATLNLTSITDYERALVLHVLDSLLALPELDAAPEGALLDMGSGAGYPGLPLAILTGRPTTLLDAREKKINALQDFLSKQATSLSVEAVAARAEEFAGDHLSAYAAVTARALSALPSLLELASPLLQQGGRLLALKGQLSADELSRAAQLVSATGLSLVGHREYSLPSGEHRGVAVYEKISAAQVELPRRPGRAQRKPLA